MVRLITSILVLLATLLEMSHAANQDVIHRMNKKITRTENEENVVQKQITIPGQTFFFEGSEDELYDLEEFLT